jgi:hypothetical protein
MYLTSMGEEAKTKKAKNVLIYSIIGVVLSVSAYAIVDIIDRFTLK